MSLQHHGLSYVPLTLHLHRRRSYVTQTGDMWVSTTPGTVRYRYPSPLATSSSSCKLPPFITCRQHQDVAGIIYLERIVHSRIQMSPEASPRSDQSERHYLPGSTSPALVYSRVATCIFEIVHDIYVLQVICHRPLPSSLIVPHHGCPNGTSNP